MEDAETEAMLSPVGIAMAKSMVNGCLVEGATGLKSRTGAMLDGEIR